MGHHGGTPRHLSVHHQPQPRAPQLQASQRQQHSCLWLACCKQRPRTRSRRLHTTILQQQPSARPRTLTLPPRPSPGLTAIISTSTRAPPQTTSSKQQATTTDHHLFARRPSPKRKVNTPSNNATTCGQQGQHCVSEEGA